MMGSEKFRGGIGEVEFSIVDLSVLCNFDFEADFEIGVMRWRHRSIQDHLVQLAGIWFS